MSLVLSVAFEDCAVVVSDGLMLRVAEDETLIPVSNDHCKFWTLGNIVLGSTGSALLASRIREYSEVLVKQYVPNHPGLFQILERELPRELGRLKHEYPEEGSLCLWGGGTNLLLTGYDCRAKRIPALCWDGDLTSSRDVMGRLNGMGYRKALDFAFENLRSFPESSGEIETVMKDITARAIEKCPEGVGGQVFSHVIRAECQN